MDSIPTAPSSGWSGGEGGTTGVDDDFARRSMEGMGAWIMGRNMFGPVRGPGPTRRWKGWWGDDPPYHVPVFVLTHHARAPLAMEGGTTFHFVTGGIQEALERASDAARGKDVRIGGGVSTVRQYLQARLVDEMHLAISPTLLGRGEAYGRKRAVGSREAVLREDGHRRPARTVPMRPTPRWRRSRRCHA